MKKQIYLILNIVMILFIWGNSCLNGTISSEISTAVTDGFLYTLHQFFNLSVEFELFHHLIRKLAHFSEYAILSIFAYKYHHSFIKAMLQCLVCASMDEMIQFFVSGRMAKISDVLIDCGGAITALLVICIIKKIRLKSNH